LVKPIKGVVQAMMSYAAEPEDARRIITPSASVRELREAETALQSMQSDLTTSLRQKERLAQLGGAVAKVSHDLRNILTVAQLFADRLEGSADPTVNRLAPKLLSSISRAVKLCETTLAFGKAEEPSPMLDRIPMERLVADVFEGEALAAADHGITFDNDMPAGFVMRADPEQLHRVVSNLVRNARQAIAAAGEPGTIRVTGREDDTSWTLVVCDTGPGLPPKARENLFRAFQGGTRKEGSGLGLAIAAELVRGHGGRLDLVRSDETGTEFAIRLPKSLDALDAAAE
jgi:signal transduction histidine kinase